MIRHAGEANRTQQDRVVVAESSHAVLRHHTACCFVGLAAPVEVAEREPCPELGADGIKNVQGSGHNLFSNSVTGDDRNLVFFHTDFDLLP